MNRESLSKRPKWQDKAGLSGEGAETTMYALFDNYLEHPYSIERKPKDLKNMYNKNHGICPDFSISNEITNKKIFVELKRQKKDGNAHERACKYLAPGIVNFAREYGNINQESFPFWLIFSGGLASDSKKREEIQFWFSGIEGNCFLWKKLTEHNEIKNHFETHIRPILD